MPKKVTISLRMDDFKGLHFQCTCHPTPMLCGLSDIQQTKERGLADLVLCNKEIPKCFILKPRSNSERENQSQAKTKML